MRDGFASREGDRAASIIDVGVHAGAWAVNSPQEVLLFGTRVWDAGTVIGPPKSARDRPDGDLPSRRLERAFNDAGVVVGSVATGGGETVPGYWDSVRSDTFTEVSFSGLTVDGEPAVEGGFSGIDASGEAVGSIEAATGSNGTPVAGLYAPGVGGFACRRVAGRPECRRHDDHPARRNQRRLPSDQRSTLIRVTSRPMPAVVIDASANVLSRARASNCPGV